MPRWIPFLDALAEQRTVVVPSLPGFPGGGRGHTVLDNHLDWVLAAHLLLHKAGLDGADLAASSVGGSLAALRFSQARAERRSSDRGRGDGASGGDPARMVR